LHIKEVFALAVTAKWYGQGPKNICNGNVIWKASGGSTIKVALLTSSYSPNQDTHDAFDDVSANQVEGTGYTAGGAALTLVDPAYDAGSNETRLDANNVSWSDSTITARYAVIYKDSGTASTSYLLGYVDFGEDKVSSAGTFAITWAADGVLKITAS
jgi:hypothetical protein